MKLFHGIQNNEEGLEGGGGGERGGGVEGGRELGDKYLAPHGLQP